MALSARQRAHTQVIWPTCSELSQAERELGGGSLIGQAEVEQCPVSRAATPHLCAPAGVEEGGAAQDTGAKLAA